MRVLRFLLRKEYRQIFRDRLMVAQMFVVPIVQLLVLANAATFEVKSAPAFVVDHDRTQASRALVDRLMASGRFTFAGSSASMDVADDAMARRDATAIVRIPHGFERDLVRAREGPVQLVLNAEDGAVAGISAAYASRIVAGYAAELGTALRPTAASVDGERAVISRPGVARLDVTTRGWYNPELNYRHYMVPGILVQLVTIVGTLLTAINIAREKEIGTLDQLNVTPVRRGQFIAAKLIPLWSIALVELGIGLAVARFVFGVPMEGSLGLVFAAAAIYLVAALGIGLWVSTLVETQQQAMFVTFFILLIYLLMSGLFTPVHSMPTWAQWLAELNPVKHFVAVMRAILLKGAGLAEVAKPLAILALYGGVVFTLAVRQYGRREA